MALEIYRQTNLALNEVRLQRRARDDLMERLWPGRYADYAEYCSDSDGPWHQRTRWWWDENLRRHGGANPQNGEPPPTACRCAACGSHRHTGHQLHHLTYERLGYEAFEDLVQLCRSCHERIETWITGIHMKWGFKPEAATASRPISDARAEPSR